ncbi:MAG: hypothetical protein MJ162_08775 [Treponema sp.]|nr:hypothetical protein [Treponema sp.]
MNMKNIFKTMLIMNSLLLAAPAIFAQAFSQKTMYVLKADSIKQKASVFGKTIYVSKLGESLIVLEEKGSWTKVQVPVTGETGWIKSKSLTKKKVNADSTSADTDEIALAGKGQEITREVIMKPASKEGSIVTVDADTDEETEE